MDEREFMTRIINRLDELGWDINELDSEQMSLISDIVGSTIEVLKEIE